MLGWTTPVPRPHTGESAVLAKPRTGESAVLAKPRTGESTPLPLQSTPAPAATDVADDELLTSAPTIVDLRDIVPIRPPAMAAPSRSLVPWLIVIAIVAALAAVAIYQLAG